MAREAFHILRDFPDATIIDAARHYRDYLTETANRQKVTVNEVADMVLKEMERVGRRQRSIYAYRHLLKTQFGLTFGDRQIATVTGDEIKDWLSSLPIAANTSRVYHTQIKTLFNAAKDRQFISKNPADFKKVESEGKEPEVFNVDQIKALMKSAVSISPEMVPLVALNVFAGIRPEAEGCRATWENIKVNPRTGKLGIFIGFDDSKNELSRRFIPFQPNLVAWVERYKPANAAGRMLSYQSYHNRMQLCKKAAGLTKWPQDVLRHTFASMHMAAFNDEQLTAAELGHRESVKMLKGKYLNVHVTKVEAAAFWAIYP